jgi:hypothetical protein
MLTVSPSSGKFHKYATCFVGSVEGPNTAGLMICVLYLVKEAELAALCDDGLKFQVVWCTTTGLSKEPIAFIFWAKQYRNCSWVTLL